MGTWDWSGENSFRENEKMYNLCIAHNNSSSLIRIRLHFLSKFLLNGLHSPSEDECMQ